LFIDRRPVSDDVAFRIFWTDGKPGCGPFCTLVWAQKYPLPITNAFTFDNQSNGGKFTIIFENDVCEPAS
jgi:hypothetical protein